METPPVKALVRLPDTTRSPGPRTLRGQSIVRAVRHAKPVRERGSRERRGPIPAFPHGDLEIRLSAFRAGHICACGRAVAT